MIGRSVAIRSSRTVFVQLTVAPDAWEAEVPKLVERAHKHGLTALDPQWERLFPPGAPYVDEK